ncbi:MAG: SDR family NAD(P)-dependent oxidoreductase [Bacillales bacterium]|jgi:NAD(P)-dependent dehydrogenase (short-subunit alcohol dehydrogenase family)|nr:SDR family NAD(P)-dependent oxidoreductase [Bacillales bacterium]
MRYLKYLDKYKINLENKIIVVTGANSGNGFFVSLQLAYYKATIILSCRNESKAQEAQERILKEVPDAKLFIEKIDIGDFENINDFVTRIKKNYGYIDILVNNAGVYYSDNTMRINYLGSYYLTKQLLPIIKERVVIVSSLVYRFGKFNYANLLDNKNVTRAYFNSKLAVYQMSIYFASLYPTIKFTIAHPGVTATNILKSANNKMSNILKSAGSNFLKLFTHCPEKASLSTIRAVIDDCANLTLYGPRGLFTISGFPQKEKPHKVINKNIDKLIEATELLIK